MGAAREIVKGRSADSTRALDAYISGEVVNRPANEYEIHKAWLRCRRWRRSLRAQAALWSSFDCCHKRPRTMRTQR
jgi:hypothetical protein